MREPRRANHHLKLPRPRPRSYVKYTLSNSLQVSPPFREVGRTALELVREGPGRVRFATGAHQSSPKGKTRPAEWRRGPAQMIGRLAFVLSLVAADWGPPEPKKRSVRQHDAIDPDMAKKIVEGKGCWWEGTTRPSPRADATRGRVGDDWDGMLTCACTCGSCDQRGPASRRLGRSRRVARGPRRGPRRPGGADRDPRAARGRRARGIAPVRRGRARGRGGRRRAPTRHRATAPAGPGSTDAATGTPTS